MSTQRVPTPDTMQWYSIGDRVCRVREKKQQITQWLFEIDV